MGVSTEQQTQAGNCDEASGNAGNADVLQLLLHSGLKVFDLNINPVRMVLGNLKSIKCCNPVVRIVLDTS